MIGERARVRARVVENVMHHTQTESSIEWINLVVGWLVGWLVGWFDRPRDTSVDSLLLLLFHFLLSLASLSSLTLSLCPTNGLETSTRSHS